MEITLLGTGSPIPDPNRAGAATLVRSGDTLLLVDAGRGVIQRLVAAGVFPGMLGAVLITHLHSDHITDLNDVITTRWIMSPQPNPLTIYGPVGMAKVVDGIMMMLGSDINYRLDHHGDLNEGPAVVVVEVSPSDVFTVGEVSVRVGATDHRPCGPTVGFRIEGADATVVMGGDGIPCDTLDELCAGADGYVQTVLRDDLVKLIPMPRLQDILDYHSTVEQAAQTAARAGVGTLVLTHYVPGIGPGQEDDWRALAAAHFSGEIILGDDLTSVNITNS
ncbi:PhnP Metal-dependent hydrolases of the beta-lactamase superfamily I [Acidimicrobiia bacterium]